MSADRRSSHERRLEIPGQATRWDFAIAVISGIEPACRLALIMSFLSFIVLVLHISGVLPGVESRGMASTVTHQVLEAP